MDAVFLSGPLKGQLPVGQRTIEVRVTFDLLTAVSGLLSSRDH